MPERVHLSYRELSERLSISVEAARVMARRRGWPRIPGNAPGAPTKVAVPSEELVRPDSAGKRPGQKRSLASPPDISALVQVIENQAETLRQTIARLEADVQRERERADALERTLRTAENERGRADTLEQRLQEAEAERTRLAVEIERLKQPWWQRLRRR